MDIDSERNRDRDCERKLEYINVCLLQKSKSNFFSDAKYKQILFPFCFFFLIFFLVILWKIN